MAIKEYRDKVIIKQRMLIVFGILFLLFFALSGRLAYLMVVKGESFKQLAIDQWTSEVRIDARRGKIVDRNRKELAVSANVYRVDVDMNTLRQTLKDKSMTMDDVAVKLAPTVNMQLDDVKKILGKKLPSGLDLSSVTLSRRIEKSDADKVSSLKIRGIIVSEDTKRYYPNDNFLSQVLGHTNSDGAGLNGVELTYNKELAGIPGRRIAETDNKSQNLPYIISSYTKPVEGKDVMLTIDSSIQFFAEKAATQALNDNKAKAATVIVMDPKTGEILALANKPDYNPNNPWEVGKTSDELQKMWRNRAVSDTFEPGSIFKVMTAATSMSENVVKENDHFVCNGSLTVANRTIHCWKTSGHGNENFIDLLKNSCNVGFMIVGQKIGKEKLTEYINKFGFGQKTGIDLPGEAKGIVKSAKDISETDLATIAFGQTNTVSCIQYLTAFNSVANGGKWIKPHVMKEIGKFNTGEKTVVDKSFSDFGDKQILDPTIAATLRSYLEKVVSEGGSKNAFIDGYHIAGKTGTAKKINAQGGGYGEGKYISSFTGMAPANDPRITVFVSIDEPDPSNYYAGQIAAPAAKQVFFDVFNYMALKADASGEELAKSMLKDVIVPNIRTMQKDAAVKLLKALNLNVQVEGAGNTITETNPIPGFTLKEGDKITLYTDASANYNKEVVVPNLKGLNKDKAAQLATGLGLKVQFTGNGEVIAGQSIDENQTVNNGKTIILELTTVGD